jgi:tRNA pseudouridine38-40 synthase
VSEPCRYRATVAYVGTFFHGWQRQKNAERTVQAAVEKALAKIAGRPVTVHASGRTDTGVHADGQVVHFDLLAALTPERLREGANGLLPWDVKLLEVARVPAGFHARRDAVWKEYLYRWSRAKVIPPSEALVVAPLSGRADAVAMAEAARLLPGERDFGVFAVRRLHGQSGVRTLYGVTLEQRGDEVRALFRGDGFLRGMVRSICGVLADVGRGKAPAERISRLLASGDRRLLSPKADACGLTLMRVSYEESTNCPKLNP